MDRSIMSPGRPDLVVVTGADAAYASLLEDWFAALGENRVFAVGILDLGLEPAQAESLRRRGAIVAIPGWDLPVPPEAATRGWFRAMTARPFLPRYFPGYRTYVWIDADAWVQDVAAIQAMVRLAEDGKVAIVAEDYAPEGIEFTLPGPTGTARRVRLTEASVRRNLARCYQLFGPDFADYHRGPILNSGVFALRGDSPSWSVWAEILRGGLRRGWHPLIEQQALTIAILGRHIAARPAPRLCNWNMGARLPIVDRRQGRLCADAAGTPIGILHLQELKSLPALSLPARDGGMVIVPLTFRAFRAAMDGLRG